MVQIIKTWETVYFTATERKKSATVELSFNHQTKKYDLTTEHEEMVSFKDNDISISKLKLKAVSAALKYIETQIKSNE